ncbi:MAG: hypothetical protein HQK50_07955 [Oligoflexia bacterium]|nr:hypothetical protein [Oligoflexia bacterium]
MMNSSGIANILGNQLLSDTLAISEQEIIIILLHSFVAGILLVLITIIMEKSLSGNDPTQEEEEGGGKGNANANANANVQLLMGASNILFLCVGITGIMILVNNNLARAFAIGAALTITRFRVKIGKKNLASNLLFGIIVGVANGLGEIKLGWMMTAAYVSLALLLVLVVKLIRRR